MDRWNIVVALNYSRGRTWNSRSVKSKTPEADDKLIADMVKVAELTRQGFINGDISTGDEPAHGDHLGARTPRSSIRWALPSASASLNKCDEAERTLVGRILPARVSAKNLPEGAAKKR